MTTPGPALLVLALGCEGDGDLEISWMMTPGESGLELLVVDPPDPVLLSPPPGGDDVTGLLGGGAGGA